MSSPWKDFLVQATAVVIKRPWNIQQEGVREGESSVAYC